MSSTLIVHNPKFAAKLATFDALANLPAPEPLGRNHKPVPHARLVEAFRNEIAVRGFRVEREQFALAANGKALFGVIDVTSHSGVLAPKDGRIAAFGFRNSTDSSFGITGVGGGHVTVCDNMLLSGSTFAISRKNTTGLDLGLAIATGFDKFLQHIEILDVEITRLQISPVTDDQAKRLIYDVFAARIVPARLFDDVNAFYFKPTAQQPECMDRTMWGVQNAFTRAMRDLTPVRQFGATVALGRQFGLQRADAALPDLDMVAVDD